MTHIYCVRHAQPDSSWIDDRTRPLTALGLSDREAVTELLLTKHIDLFISSPYRRSFDTIAHCAAAMNMQIYTDERFRERGAGVNGLSLLSKRWENFHFSEEGGESLYSVQARNIEALTEVLRKHEGKSIVLGTHGTALSMIINYYDKSFGLDDFMRIFHVLPYVIRLDFEGKELKDSQELLMLERGY